MKGDFSRVTFREEKSYNRVLMQQGRVLLDADWNEQLDIHAYLQRHEATDIIGVSGVPSGAASGFCVAAVTGDDGKLSNLSIGAGRIYIDGILCENREVRSYVEQPFLAAGAGTLPGQAGVYLVYLDVWERHVTPIEDPSIREVALGGPDTTTRVQTAWRVNWLWVGEYVPDDQLVRHWSWDLPPAWLSLVRQARGSMAARAEQAAGTSGPCIVPATAGYRRLENQLYRVEVHESGYARANGGGQNVATFKWSRDNGTVVARVTGISDNILTVSTTRSDQVQRFASGQWVEITDDGRSKRNEPGVFVRIVEVEEERIVVELPVNSPLPNPQTDGTIVTVRLWDGGSGPVEITGGDEWIALEDGVEVRFDAQGVYKSGDYWLVPARTLTGQVEWPSDNVGPLLQVPHGPNHHFCRLALLRIEADGGEGVVVRDCRPVFAPMSETELVYVSGDGQEAMPERRLPQALRVRAYNGNEPLANAWVRFEDLNDTGGLYPVLDEELHPKSVVLDGDGGRWPGPSDDVGNPDSPETTKLKSLIVPTDEDGFAECTWNLGGIATAEIEGEERLLPDQRVRATLVRFEKVDESQSTVEEVGRTITFAASFSVAWRTRYGGSDFPDRQHETAVVEHVEDALDQLRENVALAYVGGDGQQARRGEALPQPLQVRVANGQWPYAGAHIRFEITAGDGELKGVDGNGDELSGVALELRTNEHGLAECRWTPDALTASQLVEAVLLDTQLPGRQPRDPDDPNYDPQAVHGPILFNARLSIAKEVTYDGADFPELVDPALHAETVEEALDQLRENVSLAYVGGGGQEARRGEPLPQPLQVRVANGQWPYAGAHIRFEIAEGDGELAGVDGNGNELSGVALELRTNEDGLAECRWTPDVLAASQLVEAVLLDTQLPGRQSSDPPQPILGPIRFGARLSVADEVSYDTPAGIDSDATTVKEALDELHATKVDRAGDVISGSLEIGENLTVQGNLTVNGETATLNATTLEVEDNIVRVNRYDPSIPTLPINGGLEVCRGTAPAAQVVWNESEQRWKMGVEGDLGNAGYGPNWDALIGGSVVDELHRHTQLFADDQNPDPVLSIDSAGKVGIGTQAPGATLEVNGTLKVDVGEGLEVLGDDNYFGPSLDARVLRLVDKDLNRAGKVDGGLAIEGFTELDEAQRHLLAIRGSGNVGVAIRNPAARLHVVSVDEMLGTLPWPAGESEFFAFELLFDSVMPNANRVSMAPSVAGDVGGGCTYTGLNPVDLYVELLDAATGEWFAVWTHRLSQEEPEFSFNGLTIDFPARDIRGLRLRSSSDDNGQFHDWDGMVLAFEAVAPPAAVFEGQHVGVGTAEPSERLTVRNGSILLEQSGDSAAPAFKLNGEQGQVVPYIRTFNPDSATNPYAWWAARDNRLLSVEGAAADGEWGAAYFVVTSDGRVGIGRDSPSAPLVVAAGPNRERTIASGVEEFIGVAELHGTSILWDSDALFVGLKDEGSDRKDSVIIFGDNVEDVLKVQAKLSGEAAPRDIVEFRPNGEILARGTRGLRTVHPLDERRQLVHATLDGPEHAVFYRGEAELLDGKASVELPAYFEGLTRPEGRTIQLTAKGEEPFMLSYSDIEDGSFTVYGLGPDGTPVSGAFAWEVKATRADIALLEVER